MYLLFFQRLLYSFLGLAVALIAYQQYLINKRKLRLDLFEKRYVVFLEFKKLLLEIARNEEVSIFYIQGIDFIISQGKFLFQNEINEYYDEICKLNAELSQIRFKLKFENRPENDTEVKNLLDQKEQRLEWFRFELLNIEKRFEKYLSFGKVI